MSSGWVFYRLQSNNNHLFHFPFHQTHLPPSGLDAQLSAAQKSHEKEKKYNNVCGQGKNSHCFWEEPIPVCIIPLHLVCFLVSSSPRAEILASQAKEPAGLLTWEAEVARKKILLPDPLI